MKPARSTARALAAVALLAACAAGAQEERRSPNRYDVEVIGGIAGFTGGLSGVTDPGPVFGVQGEARLGEIVDVELGWRTSRFPVADTRVQDAHLASHAVSLVARVSAPYSPSVESFFGVGAGVAVIDPERGADAYFRHDVVLEVPLTAGVEFDAGPVEAGIRGTWRGLLGEPLTSDPAMGPRTGGVLSATLTLGVRL